MDKLSLVAVASIIAAGITMAIGSIGPALGQGERSSRPLPPSPSNPMNAIL